MYLNIVEGIRAFFRNLFSKFSLDNLAILIFGIIFGFILCFLIYLGFVLASLKKEEKKIIIQTDKIDLEKVERLIKSAKNQFLIDRKSTRLNSSHVKISYAVFCLKKKKKENKY